MAAKARRALHKVVIVIGTTGVGKTKLSVEIARRFNGEIVNSDAMQMYKHLDIATAKVTEEEKCGVPHHLMSFLEPTQQYSVSEYQTAAKAAIADIVARGKLPVVVGGTMFYVQSLLWNSLFNENHVGLKRKLADVSVVAPEEDASVLTTCSRDSGQARPLPETLTPEEKKELWEALKKVDPVSANRIHPNNARRVQRSLEVYEKTGRPHSEVILEHRKDTSAQELQYNAHIVWLHCNNDVLDKRLDARVEKMREQGLLAEVRQLWDQTIGVGSTRTGVTETHGSGAGGAAGCSSAVVAATDECSQRGVLKSIGFKEFCEYFALCEAVQAQTASTQATQEEGATKGHVKRDTAAVFEGCIAKLKQSTRRYARKQVQWIRNRVLTRGVKVHRYETDDVAAWVEKVREPAFEAVRKWLDATSTAALANKHSPAATTTSSSVVGGCEEAAAEFWKSRELEAWRRYYCEICDRTLDGDHEWNVHQRSRRHLKQKRFLTKPLHPKDKRNTFRSETKPIAVATNVCVQDAVSKPAEQLRVATPPTLSATGKSDEHACPRKKKERNSKRTGTQPQAAQAARQGS